MHKETHPYNAFVPEGAEKLILGSIPPWRFTVDDNPDINNLKKQQDGDIDFAYGSRRNKFWIILSDVFKTGALDSSDKIKLLLRNRKIAISDVVRRCRRVPERSALDQNLKDIEFNHSIKKILTNNPSIGTILFTSTFAEKLFFKYFSVRTEKYKGHKSFILPDDGRRIRTAVLYSPSNMALRGIRQGKEFKLRNSQDRDFSADDFRTEQYRRLFLGDIPS
jgi:G:T/U-mismatch repair DNA glycosylase